MICAKRPRLIVAGLQDKKVSDLDVFHKEVSSENKRDLSKSMLSSKIVGLQNILIKT